jgi:hypothetical protein
MSLVLLTVERVRLKASLIDHPFLIYLQIRQSNLQ